MSMNRRSALASAIAAACSLAFAPAQAQPADSFPSKALQLIVPYPPGGAADSHMRAMAEAAAPHLGQSIVIVNRPGASGTMGLTTLLSAPNDPYTVALLPTTAFRMPYMQKVAWDPVQDVSYVINVTGFAYGLVVRADAPWQNLAELIAYTKANPGKLNFGTPGHMTVPHLATEDLFSRAGGKVTHVPFKGYADEASALAGGHIDMLVDAPAWAPMVESGKFRVLATLAPERLARWPQVPTVKESGVDLVATAPYGLVTGKGVTPAQVRKLHDAFHKAMSEPVYKASMENLMQVSAYLDSAAYRSWAVQYQKDQREALERLGYLK